MKSIILYAFYIINIALALHGLYFAFIAVSGFFRKPKTYPEADRRRHFAVLIPARNEENVIGGLIDSIRRAEYPRELIDVYVVANNCTDRTAEIASGRKEFVLSCPEPAATKGEVLKFAFDQLASRDEIDAYAVFDADNIVDPVFFSEMNKALDTGLQAAQGKRTGKNPTDSWVSAGYEIYYAMQDSFYNHPRSTKGCSASVSGTGWVVTKDLIDLRGFEAETITEDYEFTIRCAMSGEKVGYCPSAVTYDEFVPDLRTSMRQRIRWAYGIVQCARRYEGALLREAVRGSVSCRDAALLNLIPWMSLLSLIPFFGGAVLIDQGVPYLLYLLMAMFGVWLGLSAVALIATAVSRRGSVRRNLKGILTFAFFIISWLPGMISCLFRKDVEWTPIRHGRSAGV